LASTNNPAPKAQDFISAGFHAQVFTSVAGGLVKLGKDRKKIFGQKNDI